MTLIESYKQKVGRSLTEDEIDVISFAIDYMHKREMALIDEIYKSTTKNIKEAFNQELNKE